MIKYFCDITGKEVDDLEKVYNQNGFGMQTEFSQALCKAFPKAEHIGKKLYQELLLEYQSACDEADELIVKKLQKAAK